MSGIKSYLFNFHIIWICVKDTRAKRIKNYVYGVTIFDLCWTTSAPFGSRPRFPYHMHSSDGLNRYITGGRIISMNSLDMHVFLDSPSSPGYILVKLVFLENIVSQYISFPSSGRVVFPYHNLLARQRGHSQQSASQSSSHCF